MNSPGKVVPGARTEEALTRLLSLVAKLYYTDGRDQIGDRADRRRLAV